MTEPIQPTEPTEQTPPGEPESDAHSEAAKWRKQLRAAESERDGLRRTVEGLRREKVEDVARREFHLPKPDALWRAGVTLDEMLNDDGAVDSEKVGAAITSAIESLGLRTETPKRLPPSPNAAMEGEPGGAESTWSGFLGAKR